MPTFQRSHQGEKLLVAESARATKLSVGAQFDQARHPTNMVVMPVRRDYQSNALGRLETDALQVAQGSRSSIRIEAGIDNDPRAVSDMQDDALSVPGAKKDELEFIIFRRACCLRHGLSAGAIFPAHILPARKSPSVILGRSRKTICDTRFRVPSGERSYPITQRKMLPTSMLAASRSEISSKGMVASSLSCSVPAVKSTRRATKASSSILATCPSHSCKARNVAIGGADTFDGGRLPTGAAALLLKV